jgi:hypothetical protein
VIKSLVSSSPESIRLKRAELQAEERRIGNFIEFVADGRGNRALAEALQASERKVETLRIEIQQLKALTVSDSNLGLERRFVISDSAAAALRRLERR